MAVPHLTAYPAILMLVLVALRVSVTLTTSLIVNRTTVLSVMSLVWSVQVLQRHSAHLAMQIGQKVALRVFVLAPTIE